MTNQHSSKTDIRAKAEAIADEYLTGFSCRTQLADAIEAALLRVKQESKAAREEYKSRYSRCLKNCSAYEKIIEEMEQELEDAELLVWSLARGAVGNQTGVPFIVQERDGEKRWMFLNRGWTDAIYLGNGPIPVLTDEAREALKKAKEEST